MGRTIERWDLLREWIGKSSSVLVKKLSRNDCSWADDSSKHQNGVYIPEEIRESRFFPLLSPKDLKPHIFEAEFYTVWPAAEGEVKFSSVKHFSNKGAECHMTRVPKKEFSCLTPASLLVGGILNEPLRGEIWYWFVVVDSASDDAEIVETIFELGVDFECEIFDPLKILQAADTESEKLIEEISLAISMGRLSEFVTSVSKLPRPEVLAKEAQSLYISANGLKGLNPYDISCPGDAVMRISRDIEFSLYKRAERRHRAADVVRIISEGGTDLVRSVVHGFPSLNSSFLSASQHRKTRAGRSFEQHISRLLKDGGVSFQEQYITSGRRPDFVLPDGEALNSLARSYDGALVLSAKTTLRERWKQVALEKFNCGLFLATVDDRVSSEAIDDMNKKGIFLVVPEMLKSSDGTCYQKKGNVLTFREFFDEEILNKRPGFLYWSV